MGLQGLFGASDEITMFLETGIEGPQGPKGDNGDKELTMSSSTEGSTKKFKITVDDTGALTATEVTS